MKPSELRDKTDEELTALESDLREQLVKLRVARATARRVSSAQFSRIRRDIARIYTIRTERTLVPSRE